MKKVIVTGGSGFIGSHLVEKLIRQGVQVHNLDKRTYCANDVALEEVAKNSLYSTCRTDIADTAAVAALFSTFQPDALFHLAAESHVDNSISSAGEFIQTNIVGTYSLLQVALDYFEQDGKEHFKFVHVSTDEVYGSLETLDDAPFNNATPYAPNSPYSASKAASDHLVRAWHKTYKLPTITTHCSNNYGPWQFPEKLIPRMISCALNGEKLPIYGTGENIRDWIHVEDHVAGILAAYSKGKLGEVYNFGGEQEESNINLVKRICDYLDTYHPKNTGSYHDQILFVEDRKGHDFRYAICNDKSTQELGWQPTVSFDGGFNATIAWYVQQHKN